MKKIKDSFKRKDLFDQAMTHKSWVNENPVRASNERLEFLGDAVLEFVVSEAIYRQFPDEEEGYLTALRSNLVNTKNLSKIAGKMGIGEMLFLSKGEDLGGGRDNPSILENTFEALIGAIFLDRGLEKAQEFILVNLLIDIKEKINQPLKDPKSRLQETAQSKGFGVPRYHVVETSGPDHDKKFVVGVAVGKKEMGQGKGKSKVEAQQKAAEEALKKLL